MNDDLTPERAADELAAVSQELGLYDERDCERCAHSVVPGCPDCRPAAREIPADEGHTWEIRIRERGSYGVVGEPGHHDAADWGDLRTVTVRAWSLAAALDKARALPITTWFEDESAREIPADEVEDCTAGHAIGCRHIEHPDVPLVGEREIPADELAEQLRWDLEREQAALRGCSHANDKLRRERDTARAEVAELRKIRGHARRIITVKEQPDEWYDNYRDERDNG